MGGIMVVDEKDIAITSAHIMTIMISIFFYCIEVAISSLWISLHNSHDLLDDHASYYTGKPAHWTLTPPNPTEPWPYQTPGPEALVLIQFFSLRTKL